MTLRFQLAGLVLVKVKVADGLVSLEFLLLPPVVVPALIPVHLRFFIGLIVTVVALSHLVDILG